MTPRIFPVAFSFTLSLASAGCGPGRVMTLDTDSAGTDTGDTGQAPGIDMMKVPDVPLCIEGTCTDGVADALLSVQTHTGGSPSLGLAVGDVVRVFGHDYVCWEDCWDSWVVVRDLADGDLVAATFGRPYPSAEVVVGFGETPQSLTAPLLVSSDGFDLCAPYDAGCDNGTYKQRGALEFGDGEALGRVLDHGVGWAPRGYHVDVPNWIIGTADCQVALYAGRVYIHRGGCGEDCPDPDFVSTCAAETSETFDGFVFTVLDYVQGPDESSDDYDAQCLVLASEPSEANTLSIPLDCVFTDPLE